MESRLLSLDNIPEEHAGVLKDAFCDTLYETIVRFRSETEESYNHGATSNHFGPKKPSMQENLDFPVWKDQRQMISQTTLVNGISRQKT